MPIHFYNTSALKHRYANSAISSRIRRAISNKKCEVYIADLTVVELASGFADFCRKSAWGQDKFDAMYRSFFKDVATKRIKVRESTPNDLEKARHLLRFARVIERHHLRSADAVIATSCRQLSYEKQARVVFYLCDKRLHRTLSRIDAYKAAVELRYVQP